MNEYTDQSATERKPKDFKNLFIGLLMAGLIILAGFFVFDHKKVHKIDRLWNSRRFFSENGHFCHFGNPEDHSRFREISLSAILHPIYSGIFRQNLPIFH